MSNEMQAVIMKVISIIICAAVITGVGMLIKAAFRALFGKKQR